MTDETTTVVWEQALEGRRRRVCRHIGDEAVLAREFEDRGVWYHKSADVWPMPWSEALAMARAILAHEASREAGVKVQYYYGATVDASADSE